MDFCGWIALVAMAASFVPAFGRYVEDELGVTPKDSTVEEEDLCYGFHENKLYCTCQPSDVDVREVDCYVLSEFPSSDALWRSFAPITRLERLTIFSQGEGTLRYVPVEALRPSAGVLQSLEIKHGSIGVVPASAFSNAVGLSVIDLANNEIDTLERGSFAQLPVLKELTLSENHLTVIRRGTFVQLPKLSVLLIDRNRISRIDDSAFEDLAYLQELTLMKNELSRLSPTIFRGLSNLKRLDVSLNRIEHLAAGVFSELTAVEEINLRENGLVTVDPKSFVGIDHLLILYLNRNRLSEIVDETFGHLPALRYLDLRNNRLVTLSEDAVASLKLRKSNGSHVYLSGNEFACDCRILWMLEMARLEDHDELSQWKQIECRLPPPASKRDEDIEENKLMADVDSDELTAMSDSPEKSSIHDDRQKFVSLAEAANHLEPSTDTRTCPESTPVSPPAKSDLTSDRALVDQETSGSRRVRFDLMLVATIVSCLAIETFV